jgi:hypothetical protein
LERRISSLQKAQVRERQFSDGRLKDHIVQNEKLEAENLNLKQLLKSTLSYKEKTGMRKAPVGKSAIANSPSFSLDKAVDVDKVGMRVLQNAKPSFIEEFNAATATAPLAREGDLSKKNGDLPTTDLNMTASGTTKKPVLANAWKSRTSPDLLRDHEERIVFTDLPSTSSSLASSTSVLVKKPKTRPQLESGNHEERIVFTDLPSTSSSLASSTSVLVKEPKTRPQLESEENPNFQWKQKASVDFSKPTNFTDLVSVAPSPKPENALKNELLEKIRLLDVSRKEGVARNIQGLSKVV